MSFFKVIAFPRRTNLECCSTCFRSSVSNNLKTNTKNNQQKTEKKKHKKQQKRVKKKKKQVSHRCFWSLSPPLPTRRSWAWVVVSSPKRSALGRSGCAGEVERTVRKPNEKTTCFCFFVKTWFFGGEVENPVFCFFVGGGEVENLVFC